MIATTDPQDERFDVLHPDGTPAGYAKPRREIHRDGDWHRALHIWVGGIGEDGEPFVLFQQRSATKDTFPNLLDVAVGGHVRAGETIADTAREAEEEIGLSVTLAELTRIGTRFVAGRSATVHDCEVQEVYAYRSDAPLAGYQLHPEEVDALCAVPLAKALALFAGERRVVPAQRRPQHGPLAAVSLPVTAFISVGGAYIPTALRALQDLLAGRAITPFTLHEPAGRRN